MQALEVTQELAGGVAKAVPILAGPVAVAKNYLEYVKVDSEAGTLTIGNRDPVTALDYSMMAMDIAMTGMIVQPALGALRPPARSLLPGEEILLTEAQGLQTRTAGTFSNVKLGAHGDKAARYLWTIDDRGVNLARELTEFPTPRGHIVHSNLSSEAYFAGEAWFVGPNEVIINAGSGRWGDGSGVTQAMWDAAIQVWESLGYIVQALPLGER